MAIAAETAAIDIQRNIGRKRDGFTTLRADAATTTSYVATDHIDCSQANKVNVYFTMTWVDSTSHTYYVEWSHNGSTWFRSINSSSAAGTNTLTMNENLVTLGASTKWVDTFDRQGTYMRLNVKKTGGAGADSLKVEAQATTL